MSPILARHSSLAQKCLEAAILAADWLVHNQIRDELDANRGRVLEVVDRPSGQYRYSRNWVTGLSVLALLAMHSASGEAKYLDAARLGGDYLKSLQFLDVSQPLFYGAFREITPQTMWAHPRDAVSAAWGLLGLYHVTGDRDCLRRVELFADWYLTRAMTKGYPAWTAGVQEGDWLFLYGAFQCGGVAFFCDLYRLTGKRHYLDLVARPVCECYLALFLQGDGSIRTVIDPETGEDLTGRDMSVFPAHFHRVFQYNDDFAATGLLKAYQALGDRRFLEGAERFLRRLASLQNADGSLGAPPKVSACGTAILEWGDLDEIQGRSAFADHIDAAASFLLTWQERDSPDRALRGGVYGLGLRGETAEKETINSRATLYALLAWLRVCRAARFQPISLSGFLPG